MAMRQTAFCLFTMAIASIASSASANAFSREAIEDALVLARATVNKVMMGLATKADAALAEYNISAMEYEAGLISATAYCRTVQPELQGVAAGLDPQQYKQIGLADLITPQERAGLKKKWQDQVAAMDQSPDKCAAAIATTERAVFGVEDEKNPLEAASKAKTRVEVAEPRYRAGVVDAMDFWETQLDLFDAQFQSKQISLQDYCQQGREPVNDMEALDQRRKQASNNEDQTVVQLIAMKRHVYQFKVRCEGN